MALDSEGATIVIKVQLNADGFIESAGGAIVTPYIDGHYDMWLFPSDAEADANDTSDAVRVADNLDASRDGSGNVSISVEETQTLSAGQTTVTLAYSDALNGKFYIASEGVDRGRLIVDVDYTVTSSGAINIIELINSFPDDSVLTVDSVVLVSSGLVDDLSQVYEFPTVAAYKAFSLLFPVGKIINLLDRGASFTVIDGVGTATGYKIVASDQVAQSIDLIIEEKTVTAEMFGAMGDSDGETGNGNDDTGALQEMASYTTLRTIVNKRYRYIDTISIVAETNVDLRGVIYYDGPQDRVALDINNDKTVPTTLKDFFISVRSSVQSDWSSELYIGVRFSNARDSRITFNVAIGFTINVQCRGFGRGFVYNEVHLGSIGNGKYQLDLRADFDDGDVGYVNENNFYKGHFFCGSTVNNDKSRYGIRIRTNTTYINNNNRFYGPSFEMFGTLVTGGAECVPIILRNCANNYFHEIRSEQSTSDGIVVRTSEDECKRNFVSMGFIAGSDLSQSVIYPIDNQSPGYGCYFENKFNQVIKPQLSYNLFQDCTPYNATDNGFRNGLFILRSNGITYRSQTGFDIDEANGFVSVSNSRAVGVRVKLPTARTLSLLRQATTTGPGRVLIRCLDITQTPLDDTGGDLVKHSGATTFNFTSSWGNGWTVGSDSDAQYDMLFDESVEFVDVMVIGGTVNAEYFGFSVLSDTGNFNTVNVYGERTDDRMVATQAPNLLAWKQGDRVYNHAAASLGFEGWVATADIVDASVDNSAFKQFGSIA